MSARKNDRTDDRADDAQAAPYTTAPPSAAALFEQTSPRVRQALVDRLRTLVATLGGDPGSAVAQACDQVESAVGRDPELLWLAASVLAAAMPDHEDMAELLVRAQLAGPWAALASVVTRAADASLLRDVEVVSDAVLCDVHSTSESRFLSGIQRVVRETAARWHAARAVEFVGWTTDQTGLRRIRAEDEERMFGGRAEEPPTSGVAPVVIPWQSTLLWVEVITDLRRSGRLLALARYSRNRLGVLGYDSIPVTSSHTVAQGMTSHFARALTAARRADRVGLISAAAAAEFRGVMAMGRGRRDDGPEVAAVPLAVEAQETTEADLAEARSTLVVGDLPMVLVVGSHEPRKNHLAVLHAAELLWREGLLFSLVFVGAGSWGAEEYGHTVDELVGAGRPVQSIRGLPDRLLWAAYRLAFCTVFPSLNEGFGLPVAESLAVGTPVVTSDVGSMRDIVAPHGTPLGGLLVDPRDDASVTDALRAILCEPGLHARLQAETAEHEQRTWDTYADELWSFLVEGVRPPGDPRQAPA